MSKTNETPTRGILYIAFGEKYRREARVSMASVRATTPGVEIAVVTDIEWQWEPGPEHLLLRPGIFSWESKPRYVAETPFDETLFLDTDTFVCRDLSLGFGLLRHYDAAVLWGGSQFNHGDGLEFHPRANSGAVLFKKSAEVDAVLAEWYRLYKVECDERGKDGVADERSLTVALGTSRIRVGALANFFHVPMQAPCVFNSPPVILHGRLGDIQKLSGRIAAGWDQVEDWHPRIWLSYIRGMLPRNIREADPLLALYLLIRRFINERWLRIR